MHEMTAGHLRSAYGGESMAHMRYISWGARAEKDGFPNVARLFAAISYAEQVHATKHLYVLKDQAGEFAVTAGAGFGISTTSDNLDGAIMGETFEIEEMYPVYIEAAKFQGEKAAERSFYFALEAEKIHVEMYKQAKQAVAGGKDIEFGPVHVCGNCGYTTEGEVPDKCPICGASRDKFKTFE